MGCACTCRWLDGTKKHYPLPWGLYVTGLVTCRRLSSACWRRRAGHPAPATDHHAHVKPRPEATLQPRFQQQTATHTKTQAGSYRVSATSSNRSPGTLKPRPEATSTCKVTSSNRPSGTRKTQAGRYLALSIPAIDRAYLDRAPVVEVCFEAPPRPVARVEPPDPCAAHVARPGISC